MMRQILWLGYLMMPFSSQPLEKSTQKPELKLLVAAAPAGFTSAKAVPDFIYNRKLQVSLEKDEFPPFFKLLHIILYSLLCIILQIYVSNA